MVDKLESELMKESDEVVLNGLPYIHTFKTFDDVVKRCFGVKLLPGYETAINTFKDTYVNLGITVTPKVNIIVTKHFIYTIFPGSYSLPAHHRVSGSDQL